MDTLGKQLVNLSCEKKKKMTLEIHHTGEGGKKNPPTFWLSLKAKQKTPVIKDKWKITAYYMVLHSLQKLQVLITNWTSHLSSERTAGALAQPATKHAQSVKAPCGWGYCFQHKGNKGVDGLSVQAAILPSPGRSSLLKGTLELPSGMLKAGGVIFTYPPRPSSLLSVQYVFPDLAYCSLL